MNFFDDNIILDFLEKKLSSEDELLFKAELAKNAELKSKVELAKDAITAVKIGGRKELSRKIRSAADNKLEIQTTNEQKTKTIKMNTEKKKNNNIMRVIAAALALFIVGYGVGKFLKGDEVFDPSAVFADNYKPSSAQTSEVLTALAKSNTIARGVDPTEDEKMVIYKGKEITAAEFAEIEKLRKDTLIQGLKLFEKSKWLESKQVLSKYTENYKTPLGDYATALYYLAKTSMNQGMYDLAANNLEEFISIPSADGKMLTEAQWERALCYLKVNELKAKELFDTNEAKGILAYFD